ncbi:NADPH dehydrogenase NamA [Fervidibacillus halotolerans]|uniref:NADPH dehydrogenase NamA n=1 Tax=Fervidibacillus halotolerans TaxID=2980027 RepID=A0A9E8M3Q2_9BACI|nr:NADPH dehydrogenase NamA [Fervidibacillus halotolerans]WAA13839.1 NADPH dehydrogenase NamA [Fervidibacillus halotolerans]
MGVKLFEPYSIRQVTFPNRIVMSPMCMYASEKEDGTVQNWHITHYVSRAVGQTGLIILEATAVTPEGRISSKDLGIWDDQQIDGLKNLVQQMKTYGVKTGIQLAHAGRKATVAGNIVAPSPISYNEKFQTPKELTKKEIADLVQAFKKGAMRAKEAGFDVIEIHAAHGYLIHQFLSPLTNKRTDEYGNTEKNRTRFLREIVQEVRKIWEGPLFVRVSATDYHPEGLKVHDYIALAKELKMAGVDLIDVSSGGIVTGIKYDTYPGYQVPFAEKIKHGANIPVGAVGLITSPEHAEEILQNNRADLVFIGRELLRNPYWPYYAAKKLGVEIPTPIPYKRGWI